MAQATLYVLMVLWLVKRFPISALTPSVKPLGLISTFAPIVMLDLSFTLPLTPHVKWVFSKKSLDLNEW
jgi:hypothetical protein